MQLEQQKEAFSRAYVQAIASVAGFNCIWQHYDNDSVDIGFKYDGDQPFITIEAQLKASSRSDIVHGDEIRYPLKIKNYNDLRGNTILPRILIVLILPDKNEYGKEQSWINQTAEQLTLYKCAYWINLKGQPDSVNNSTVTITIPMDEKHIFNPSALSELCQEVLSSRRNHD
jgi:hypothetical protein